MDDLQYESVYDPGRAVRLKWYRDLHAERLRQDGLDPAAQHPLIWDLDQNPMHEFFDPISGETSLSRGRAQCSLDALLPCLTGHGTMHSDLHARPLHHHEHFLPQSWPLFQP